MEVPGYGCEDHFSELDTIEHSWECIRVRVARFVTLIQSDFDRKCDKCGVQELIEGDYTRGMVCDIGIPVIHAGEYCLLATMGGGSDMQC